ncbi:MAG: L,D-transpeptidase [Sulfurovum sp.]|nr:L,D-transpeptidase [Sulfurovum sp.]
MKNRYTISIVLSVLISLLMSGCAILGEPSLEDINCTKLAGKFTTHQEFKKCTKIKSYKVYKDNELLKEATPKNTKVVVDVSDQRARLFVDEKVAVDSPCTTGAKRKFEPNTKIFRDKRTPTGKFCVTEKISNKRSTIFGKYYKGKRCVYTGDKRKYRGSKKGLRYEGAALSNWMRLTGSGIGLHASKYIKRYPGTNGCIRLPYHVSKTIFKHVRKGTPVTVQN